MSYDNFYTFICFGCLFTVDASSRWVSLTAFGGPDASKTISEPNNNGKSESMVSSPRIPITTEYLSTETITNSTVNSLHEDNATPSTAPEVFENEVTQIYVRLPGSNQYEESLDTIHSKRTSPFSYKEPTTGQGTEFVKLQVNTTRTFFTAINRTTFRDDLIWKLVRNNQTNIQVTLHPAMKNSLPELSQIEVNFDPRTNDERITSACTLSNVTCGPMVEIVAQQIPAETASRKPIIEIRFNTTEYSTGGSGHEWKCVYWSENGRAWKCDGLETVNSNDSSFIICQSTHLTLFSILLDPHSTRLPSVEIISDIHETNLTAFSLAGSIVTVSCLLITISSYFCKRPSDNETSKILLHNCVALLLVHASFHAYHWLGKRINCRVINFWTHYSVLAFLLWAAFDGVNMWRLLFNDIFNTRGRAYYKLCVTVSWGFPLLTSAVGVLATNYPTTECRLGFNRVYEFGLHIVPCFIILGSNLLFFVWMAVRVLGKNANSLRRLRDKKIKYLVALAQVFNVVWCVTFPLLWFGETRLVGQYLIAALVSAQGALILIVRASHDSELKQRWSRSLCVRRTKSLSPSSILGVLSSRNTDSVSKTSDL